MHYPVGQSLWFSILEIFVQLPIDMAFCYFVIYVLVPRYLLANKIRLFFLSWIASVLVISIINHFYAEWVVLPMRYLIHKPVPQQASFLLSVLTISLSFNMEAGLATSIRLIKYITYQKKEASLIKKEFKKKLAEDKLTVNSSGSSFIENIIDETHKLYDRDNKDATFVKEHLKRLISYSYLIHKDSFIPLEDEMNALVDYLEIQKITHQIPYELNINEDAIYKNKKIASYTLIPLLEPYFKTKHNCPNAEVAVSLHLVKQIFHCCFQIKNINNNFSALQNANDFNVYSRLTMKYPEKFKLTKTIKEDTVTIMLKIQLNKMIQI